MTIFDKVGRKVAHVLESLGRSAESIQEAEVGIIRFCVLEVETTSVVVFLHSLPYSFHLIPHKFSDLHLAPD